MEMRMVITPSGQLAKEVLIKFKAIEGRPIALDGSEDSKEILCQWIGMHGTYKKEGDADVGAYYGKFKLDDGEIIEFPVVTGDSTGWAQVDDSAALKEKIE